VNPAITTARDIRFNMATATEAAGGLETLLVTLTTWIRRYVVVTDAQAVAIVLWAAHTHAIDAADCTPYLQITSATKRAGKTRLLEVLEPIVARPWFTGRTSAAALVRKVDAECPTLLLDESDAAFGGEKEYAEALRGILNSGYRSSGRATLCIGQGTKIEARDFKTFGAKAVAGIGALPDTVADRSIAIQLRRRTHDEPCERWRERDGHHQAAPLHAQLAAWATTAVEVLRDARPALPSSLGDRQTDVWEPLIAIADLAGGTWSTRARSAAVALAGSVEDQDITVELLTDIRDILVEEHQDRSIIASKDLIAGLTALDDRPWATWRRGQPMTPRGLTRLLGPLQIHPDRHLRTVRGYRIDAFTDAIARYLPSQVSLCHNPNETGPEPRDTCEILDPPRDTYKTAKTPIHTGVVTHDHIDHGKQGKTGIDDGLPADFVPPNGISRSAYLRHHVRKEGLH
jgi:hypothetical protein